MDIICERATVNDMKCKFLAHFFDYSDQAAIMPVPQLQKPAPAFSSTAVVNGQFKDIKLSDFKGKYVVLFFYPLDL